MLVQDFLHNSAERFPQKTALVCDGQRLTYTEIDAMADRLANALHQHGVRRGDRIAIYMPNSVQAVIGIFAALKAGAVFVVINATTKIDKLAFILNDCAASAVISEARQSALLEQVVDRVPSLKVWILASARENTSGRNGTKIDGDLAKPISIPTLQYHEIQESFSGTWLPQTNIDLDLACLIYTSGSTGDPKGVMSDHSNVVFAASSITQYLENTPADIVLNALPLSFDYGLYQLLMVFKFGGTLVLERSFAYPAAILKRMAEERVTGFPGVPTLFSLLLKMDLGSFDLSSLRYLTNTAAALPASHIQSIRQNFPCAK
jgi:long-chain acyl-CoA synthetase